MQFYACMNQQGIQWDFPTYHHIPKQYSLKTERGSLYRSLGFSSTEKRLVLEWYFTVWELSNICELSGKMSRAFSASLGLHWQIWFHCDWYWLQLLMLWLVYILFTQQLIMDKHSESTTVFMQCVLSSMFKISQDLVVLDVTFRTLNTENNNLRQLQWALFVIYYGTRSSLQTTVCHNTILPASVILGEHGKHM